MIATRDMRADGDPGDLHQEPSLVRWCTRLLRRKPVNGLRGDRRTLALAFLGAVMGTVLDALHVFNKTAFYQDVWTFPVIQVAWYVPFEFALGGVTVGLLRPELDEKLGRKRAAVSIPEIAMGLALFTLVWFLSGFLSTKYFALDNRMIAACLAVIALAAWALLDKTWQGAVTAACTTAIGLGVELGLVATGTYRYTAPDFFGLPIWLLPLYVVASIAVGNLGRFMKYTWDRETAGVLTEIQRAA